MDLSLFLSAYELLHPQWLWLILPLIIYLVLQPFLIKTEWLKQNSQTNFVTVKHPYAMDNSALHLNTKKPLHGFSIFLTGCLFILALTQPVKLGEKIKKPTTSADIMLIIDTSISMVIKDYILDGKRINRMTMTQTLLSRFSKRFSGQRIGIVIFGEPPQIILQPSQDKDLVQHLIYRLKPTVAGRMAALGDAVTVAADYIQLNKKSNQKPTETVLVLISDAVSPSGKVSPIEGAKRVAKSNITLYTIAIGSTDSEKNNASASIMGELLYEATDITLLQKMANITGGKSFHGIDAHTIDTALDYIEQHHRVESDDIYYPQKKQALYFWPLLFALFLLGLKTLFENRNKKSSAI